MSSEAFVTLATNDGYGLGALVLAESIRQVGTKRNLVVLISNHLSDLIRQTLEKSFDEVIVVEELDSNDVEHLNLLSRPELGITFTKINCWLLEQYSKCVFLDADCVVLRPIDDLFQREELSAAPDAGWPDCFNSGVFVYRPSKDTFNKLTLFASEQNASFDGGDQGLLNAFFSNWGTGDISRHLPFTYNVTANAFYSYLPAVTRFRNDIHIVHFAGALKPWQLTFNPQNEQLSGNLGGQSDIQRDFLLAWWRVMHQQVWPSINKLNQQSNSNNQTIDGEGQYGGSLIGSLNYGNLTANKGIEVGSVAHRRAWEAGHIDYFGRDSFLNIQQQLERNIQQRAYEYHPSQQRQISPEKTTTTTTTTTSILKSSLKEPTPPPQLQQQTTTTTTLTTAIVETSLKATTPLPQYQQPTTVLSQKLPTATTVISQNVTELPTTTTTTRTNVSQNLAKQSTPLPTQSANTLKSAPKETTTTTTTASNVSQNVPKQSTSTLKSSLKETAPVISQTVTELPTTTKINVSQNLSKQSTPLPTQSTNAPKSLLKETTATTASNVSQNLPKQSTNTVKSSVKETTPVISQTVTELPTRTNVSQNLSKQSTPLSTQATSTVKSSSKETTTTASNVSPNVLKDSTPVSTNPLKSTLEGSTTKVSQTASQREIPQTLVGSIRSNENKTPPLAEHESNWTVKSTIVTSYTQGAGVQAGPTVVSKVVSESSATSSSDVPIKTSIKPMTDSTKASASNTTGNATSVRGVTPSTNNGNRVNK